jgi:hypothetical protein
MNIVLNDLICIIDDNIIIYNNMINNLSKINNCHISDINTDIGYTLDSAYELCNLLENINMQCKLILSSKRECIILCIDEVKLYDLPKLLFYIKNKTNFVKQICIFEAYYRCFQLFAQYPSSLTLNNINEIRLISSTTYSIRYDYIGRLATQINQYPETVKKFAIYYLNNLMSNIKNNLIDELIEHYPNHTIKDRYNVNKIYISNYYNNLWNLCSK